VVHEKHRREGCGAALLNRMKKKMRGKFKFLKLDVRDTNLDAHLFLRKNGFVAELARGHFQDHYPNEPVKYQDGYFFTYQKDLDNEEFNFGASGCPVRINNVGE
jgi:ribosomal protein S18 acetylase RimI-like enzyme